MTPTVFAVLATILISLVGIIYAVQGWLTKRSWRALLRGAGLVLVPVGLLASGLMKLAVNGVYSLVDWSGWDRMGFGLQIGLWLGGIGIVIYVIGSFLPLGGRASEPKQLASGSGKKGSPAGPAAVGGSRGNMLNPSAQPPKPASGSKNAGISSEDAEIDEILKRHGF
jgi:hypothetical protein